MNARSFHLIKEKVCLQRSGHNGTDGMSPDGVKVVPAAIVDFQLRQGLCLDLLNPSHGADSRSFGCCNKLGVETLLAPPKADGMWDVVQDAHLHSSAECTPFVIRALLDGLQLVEIFSCQTKGLGGSGRASG